MLNPIKIKSRSNLVAGDIPVITMTPLWSEPMETTLNTQTTILETLSGKESRTARLYRPLVGVDFVGIATDQAEHQLFKTIFSLWKDSGMYAVPLWMDAVQLDADITPTPQTPTTYFFANGFNRLFRWFRYALLWESPENCEVIEIKRIGKSGGGKKQIVCRGFAPVTGAYNTGAFLVPLAIGSISQPDREFLTNAINTIQISFTEKQGAIKFYDGSNESDSLAYYHSYTPRFGNEQTPDNEDVTYPDDEKTPSNYDQFELMPNWDLAENIYSDQDDVYFDAIDGGLAKPYIINQNNKLRISLGFTLDREELQYLLKFFEHHDGAKGEFWVPTWTADCVYDGNTLTNVFVVRKDLSIHFYGKLTDQEDADDINFVCKAVKCRFAEDTLEITATTNNLYQVVCSFVQCECAYPVEDTQIKTIYLYELTKQGGSTNRYANYGYGVSYVDTTANPNVTHYYTAADISYTEIVKDVETLDNKIEVSCSGLDSNLALNMRVEIKKVDIKTDGTILGPTSIFKGIVTKLSTEANGVKSMAVESDLYPLNNEIPRVKLQRQCNWDFGGESCGINNEKNVLEADSEHSYIYVEGDNGAINAEKAKKFIIGVSAGGVKYPIEDIDRCNTRKGNTKPVLKFKIAYDNYKVTNDLAKNAAVGWYSDKVLINDVWWTIQSRVTDYPAPLPHNPPDGYTRLKLARRENVDLGTVINDPTSIYNEHYEKFLFQVFQQDFSVFGYSTGAIPLSFQTTYFKQETQNTYLMSCFFYAPSYVGRSDVDILYLPKIGEAVSIQPAGSAQPLTLHVKGYDVDNTSSYIIFEEDVDAIQGIITRTEEPYSIVSSLTGKSLLYNENLLHWVIGDVVEEYNILRLQFSAENYSHVSGLTKLKLRRYCNKKISCCKECYNNVARFGGFPWLPNNTPYEYTENTSSGKK
jgi:hypothetical protein